MDPVILLLRILIPLSIFRFPFWGALASLFLDGVDWNVNFFNIANIHANYVLLDKILDLYYLSIEAFVLLKWKSIIAKKTGIALYAVRAVGIILFAIFGNEFLLFIFPNIFENYFIFYWGVWTLSGREPKISPKLLAISVFVLAIPKIFQEYIMHVKLISLWRYVYIPNLNITYDNIDGQIAIGIILILAVWIISRKGLSAHGHHKVRPS